MKIERRSGSLFLIREFNSVEVELLDIDDSNKKFSGDYTGVMPIIFEILGIMSVSFEKYDLSFVENESKEAILCIKGAEVKNVKNILDISSNTSDDIVRKRLYTAYETLRGIFMDNLVNDYSVDIDLTFD